MTPLLPLETFRQQLGFNPWHFYQLTNERVPVTAECNTLIFQENWQAAQAVGRTAMLRAIEDAEAMLLQHLRYSPAPRYAETTLPFPRPYARGLHYGASIDADGRWLAVSLPEGYVQALGVESKTLIGAANVTYSDADGDGLDETFVVTIATTVTDTTQIAVYFAFADRLDSEGATERWRIQPVSISINGGTATIRGRAWLLVKPILYEGVNPNGLDPATSSNFVTQLEVYQRRTNGAGTTLNDAQGVLTWETEPIGWAGCCAATTDPADSSLDPGAIATAIARVGLRDSKLGLVIPAEAAYNSTSSTWAAVSWSSCSTPDRVLIRYLAGYPLVGGQMAPQWQTTVARLAMAELDGPLCGCEQANHTLYRWQLDLAVTSGRNDELLGGVSAADLDNPLGTRRGHVYAWRQIRSRRFTSAFVAG